MDSRAAVVTEFGELLSLLLWRYLDTSGDVLPGHSSGTRCGFPRWRFLLSSPLPHPSPHQSDRSEDLYETIALSVLLFTSTTH